MNTTTLETPSSLLLIRGTHGNEVAEAAEVIAELTALYGQRCDCIVGNEQAAKAGVRFLQKDMNRSALPSQPDDDACYEVRRACEVVQIADRYPYTVDLHTTIADCDGGFTLIPNPRSSNLLLASALAPERVVIWAANVSLQSGPPTQFMRCGVEIEFGPRSNPEGIKREMRRYLEPLFAGPIEPSPEKLAAKKIYRVFGSLSSSDVTPEVAASFKDFQPTIVGGKTCFPLLAGQYRENQIICYLMEEVNLSADDLQKTDQELWDAFAY